MSGLSGSQGGRAPAETVSTATVANPERARQPSLHGHSSVPTTGAEGELLRRYTETGDPALK
ncbi:MAG: hypothetical protein AABM66_07810, partial [Actinomycetota bacterium]